MHCSANPNRLITSQPCLLSNYICTVWHSLRHGIVNRWWLHDNMRLEWHVGGSPSHLPVVCTLKHRLHCFRAQSYRLSSTAPGNLCVRGPHTRQGYCDSVQRHLQCEWHSDQLGRRQLRRQLGQRRNDRIPRLSRVWINLIHRHLHLWVSWLCIAGGR